MFYAIEGDQLALVYFSTKSPISRENPQALATQNGWSPYRCRKNYVCCVKRKTEETQLQMQKC